MCNWNKRDDVINCINSVIKSNFNKFEIYVVDNASEDDSVEWINKLYKDSVCLILNSENKGGSGGFNAGIKIAIQNGHKYIHLLDNDVELDFDAIGSSYEYMEEHDDIAAIGSKLYSYYQPGCLQEMGSDIDWNNYYIRPHYKGANDHGAIPEIIDCDYVPACSVMIRVDAIVNTGLMDEGYFIYWDDIEFFYKMKSKGQRVIAYGKSKAWHKMGVSDRQTTFGTYYFWRNRIHFFVKYLTNDQLNDFGQKILKEAFQAVYFSAYKGQFKIAQTIITSFRDSLQGIRGKAQEARIHHRESYRNPLDLIINNYKAIEVIETSECAFLHVLIKYIKSQSIDMMITIRSFRHNIEELKQQFPTVNIIPSDYPHCGKDVLLCQTTDHIVNIRNEIREDIDFYVDSYFNVVSSQEDRINLKNYDAVYQAFINIWFPVLQLELKEFKKKLNLGG
nr:glycosyltransferase family 2 protein [Ammoniphilus sp. CFH 90114]